MEILHRGKIDIREDKDWICRCIYNGKSVVLLTANATVFFPSEIVKDEPFLCYTQDGCVFHKIDGTVTGTWRDATQERTYTFSIDIMANPLPYELDCVNEVAETLAEIM